MKVIAAGVLAVAAASSCRAEPVPVVQPKLTDVMFNGTTQAGDDPMDKVRALHSRIESELRESASSDGAKAAVGRDQYGFRGERILISAITPKKGYFAFVPLGSYEEDSAVGIARKRSGKLPVCRFEIAWDSLPESFSAAGLTWASRLFPTTDCKPSASDSKSLGWENKSGEATYSIVARRGAAGIRAVLIAENFPLHRAPQTVNLSRAIEAALAGRDRIDSVVPLPSFPDARAFARTSNGKSLLAMSASDDVTGCVVEGLNWDAAAERFGVARRAAEQLCAGLLAEWKKRELERLMRDAETNPPTLTPIDRN